MSATAFSEPRNWVPFLIPRAARGRHQGARRYPTRHCRVPAAEVPEQKQLGRPEAELTGPRRLNQWKPPKLFLQWPQVGRRSRAEAAVAWISGLQARGIGRAKPVDHAVDCWRAAVRPGIPGPAACSKGDPTVEDQTFEGLLDVARLNDWIAGQDLPGEGPVTAVTKLQGGSQNNIFRMQRGGAEMVLRRPPRHLRDNSNETMLREAGSSQLWPAALCPPRAVRAV